MSEETLLEEDAIWEYKSIRKQKSQCQKDAGDCTQIGQKTHNRKSKSKRSVRKKAEIISKKTETTNKSMQVPTLCSISELTPEKNMLVPNWNHIIKSQKCTKSPTKPCTTKLSPQIVRPVHDGHCPNCQMPFSVLLVQSPRWHVDECLDAKEHGEKECPDGLQCSSTIPSHYKRFTHFQLARSRAGTSLMRDDLTLASSGADTSDGGVIGHVQTPPPTSEDISYSPIASDGEGEAEEGSEHLRKSLFYVAPSQDYRNEKEGGVLDASVNSGEQWKCGLQRTVGERALKLNEEALDEGTEARRDGSNTEQAWAASQPCSSLGTVRVKEEPDWMGLGSPASSDAPWDRKGPEAASRPHSHLPASSAAPVPEEAEMSVQPMASSPFQQSQSVFRFRGACASSSPELFSPPRSGAVKEESLPLSQTDAKYLLNLHVKTVRSVCVAPNAKAVPPKALRQTDIGVFFGLKPKAKEEKAPERILPQRPASATSAGTPTRNGASATSAGTPTRNGASATSAGAPKGNGASATSAGTPKGKGASATSAGTPKGNGASATSAGTPKGKGASATSEGTPKGNRASQRKRKATGSVGDTDAVPGALQSSEVPAKTAGRGQQGWAKRFREADGTEGQSGKKQCPFYKKIPGTGFTVDAFQFGKIEGCTAYFLTHFHSDHYGGLTKKFQCPIYCSKITGNLVRSKLRVEERFINTLPMDTECVVEGVKVVLLEANQNCTSFGVQNVIRKQGLGKLVQGAVLLLFCLPNGSAVLHTGDFRADPSMEQYPTLIGRKIHTLYLDTTYCSPEYTFPPQQEAIQFAATRAFETVTLYPRTLVVCGTYSVGKEKVFLAIADVLGCKVCMSQDKYKTLQCLESKEIASQITTDWNSTSLHVLPMMQVNVKGLLNHFNKFSGRYDRVLAFKPTGWTYSNGCASVADIKPTVRGKITMYGIPYSEHSSYLEMKRFVQWLRPQKIIPTVNMGNSKTRTTMEKYFSQWLMEPAPRLGKTC